MVEHLTHGIVATGAGTRIHTLVAYASLVPRTVRRECALGSATLVGISLVVVLAATLTAKAIGIGSTGIRATWIVFTIGYTLRFWLLVAAHEWISGEAFDAVADGQMVEHMALGLETTRARAGIATFLIDARLGGSALGIEYALGTATWWGANKVRQARTGRTASNNLTLGVGSTGRRHTRWCWWFRCGHIMGYSCGTSVFQVS